MIRKIGDREDPFEWKKTYEARLRGMEELAGTHITWFTHKNPYGCWICDLFILAQACLDTFQEFLGEDSPEKDTETGKSNGNETS